MLFPVLKHVSSQKFFEGALEPIIIHDKTAADVGDHFLDNVESHFLVSRNRIRIVFVDGQPDDRFRFGGLIVQGVSKQSPSDTVTSVWTIANRNSKRRIILRRWKILDGAATVRSEAELKEAAVPRRRRRAMESKFIRGSVNGSLSLKMRNWSLGKSHNLLESVTGSPGRAQFRPEIISLLSDNGNHEKQQGCPFRPSSIEQKNQIFCSARFTNCYLAFSRFASDLEFRSECRPKWFCESDSAESGPERSGAEFVQFTAHPVTGPGKRATSDTDAGPRSGRSKSSHRNIGLVSAHAKQRSPFPGSSGPGRCRNGSSSGTKRYGSPAPHGQTAENRTGFLSKNVRGNVETLSGADGCTAS